MSQLLDLHLSQQVLHPQSLQMVAARSSMTFSGSNGSSLLMISSQARGYRSVALYRITTARHDPGCSAAGNGLLISFQCLLLRRNSTLLTFSLQSPTLQIESVRSSVQQAVFYLELLRRILSNTTHASKVRLLAMSPSPWRISSPECVFEELSVFFNLAV